MNDSIWLVSTAIAVIVAIGTFATARGLERSAADTTSPAGYRAPRTWAQWWWEGRPSGSAQLAWLAGAIATAMIGWQQTGLAWVGVAGGALALAAPAPYARFETERRLRKIGELFPDALVLFGNAFRAGRNLQGALDMAVDTSPEPLRSELARLAGEMRVGFTIGEALDRFRDRIPLRDVELFTTAVQVLREKGGDLAESFDTLVATISERVRTERRVRAMLAQVRAQAVVLALAPFLSYALLRVMDPGLARLLVDRPLGQVFAFAALVLEVIGVVLVRKALRVAA